MISTNERGEKWFQCGRIFSIQKTTKGFQFAEECDYWHKYTVDKDKALQILQSAIDYINSDDFGNIPEIEGN